MRVKFAECGELEPNDVLLDPRPNMYIPDKFLGRETDGNNDGTISGVLGNAVT